MSEVDYAGATFVKASHFLEGRSGSSVEILVVHTTEQVCAPGVARNVAGYFAAPGVTTSAHYIIGPEAVYQGVAEADTAWHAQGVNPKSIGLELTGRAAFTSHDWSMPHAQEMMALSAKVAADICKRNGIPAEFVDHEGLVRGEKGITTHAEVTLAFHKTDHTDPGKDFPFDDWMEMVKAAMSCDDASPST